MLDEPRDPLARALAPSKPREPPLNPPLDPPPKPLELPPRLPDADRSDAPPREPASLGMSRLPIRSPPAPPAPPRSPAPPARSTPGMFDDRSLTPAPPAPPRPPPPAARSLTPAPLPRVDPPNRSAVPWSAYGAPPRCFGLCDQLPPPLGPAGPAGPPAP